MSLEGLGVVEANRREAWKGGGAVATHAMTIDARELDELRQLHQPQAGSSQDGAWCSLDGERWPCVTMRLVAVVDFVNAPETDDFLTAVIREAAHQRTRWNDAQKTAADWFALVGYLAGKAMRNPAGDAAKRRHRIITVAAAAMNWHFSTLVPRAGVSMWINPDLERAAIEHARRCGFMSAEEAAAEIRTLEARGRQ